MGSKTLTFFTCGSHAVTRHTLWLTVPYLNRPRYIWSFVSLINQPDQTNYVEYNTPVHCAVDQGVQIPMYDIHTNYNTLQQRDPHQVRSHVFVCVLGGGARSAETPFCKYWDTLIHVSRSTYFVKFPVSFRFNTFFRNRTFPSSGNFTRTGKQANAYRYYQRR
jgi:hypothetical protein